MFDMRGEGEIMAARSWVRHSGARHAGARHSGTRHSGALLGRAAKFIARGGMLGALLLVAASCAQPVSQTRPCPVVKLVPDASYLTRFAGDAEDLTDTVFEAKLAGVQPKCTYSENTETSKTTILSDLLVKIMASRGPK